MRTDIPSEVIVARCVGIMAAVSAPMVSLLRPENTLAARSHPNVAGLWIVTPCIVHNAWMLGNLENKLRCWERRSALVVAVHIKAGNDILRMGLWRKCQERAKEANGAHEHSLSLPCCSSMIIAVHSASQTARATAMPSSTLRLHGNDDAASTARDLSEKQPSTKILI